VIVGFWLAVTRSTHLFVNTDDGAFHLGAKKLFVQALVGAPQSQPKEADADEEEVVAHDQITCGAPGIGVVWCDAFLKLVMTQLLLVVISITYWTDWRIS